MNVNVQLNSRSHWLWVWENVTDTKTLFEASSWSGGEGLFDGSASVCTGAFRIYMEFLNI